MGKKLAEIFKKYVPADNSEERLLNDGEVIKNTISEDKKSFVAETKFSRLYKKQSLYKAEENLRQFYGMKFIRISPKYDEELLSEDYLREVFVECSTCKGMTRGMIPKYTAEIGHDEININVWQTEAGFDLIKNANSERIISDVIFDEFGIRRKITFTRVDDGTTGYEKYEYEIANAEREAAEKALLQIKNQKFQQREDDRPDKELVQRELKTKLSSLNEDDPWDDTSDPSHIAIGRSYFNISKSDVLYGEEFEIDPVPIRTINGQISNICIVGETFGFDSRELRGKDKVSSTFYVTDGDSTIKIKSVLSAEEASAFSIKDGTAVAVKGNVKIDTYDKD